MTDGVHKHSFYDLDHSWHMYMLADRKGRREMHRRALATDYISSMITVLLGIAVLVALLCAGWI